MRAAVVCGAVVLAALNLSCEDSLRTAPPGSTITLIANPGFIAASGGVSIITALVIEPAGTPVPDDTIVQFFTNLGRIDEQGRTRAGVARVNLVADARSGTATVSAFSGGPAVAASPASSGGTGSASVQVVIGSALPARVLVTANPTRVTSPRQSLIRAFVVDANGNPVNNVPVIFTVEQPAGALNADFMESRGAPVFTDNNGVAEDNLLVRYPSDDPAKIVTIRATAAFDSTKAGTTAVTIN
ncbi:MAG: hypothetical protein AB7O37_22675 [Vicinamibacteria bacterium]